MPNRALKQKAFSLIEILIVLFILAFVFALTARSFIRPERKIKTAFEQMTRLNRRLATLSKLHNQSYRWVIQINSEGAEQYWVEKKQSPGLDVNSKEDQEEKEEEAPDFIVDNSFYPNPETLNPLLEITKVESSAWDEDKTEGLVYIYYYPKALAQETAIQVFRPDNQARWTLYLNPVEKTLRLIKGQKSLDPEGGIK